MRIRWRPQPSPQLGSDPTTTSTAPQTPQNAARSRGWLDPGGGGGGGDREAAGDKLLHAGADLAHKSGVARRLALPQDEDNVVVVDCGRSMGAQHEHGADDPSHRRFSAVSNGHHSLDQKDGVACTGGVGVKSEPVPAKAEERVTSNGALTLAVVPAVAVSVKDEGKASSNGNGSGSGGAKKRRGPAVLLEGSRCSRVNGRGWRCSQPTLVGYSLCEHHLGKGRMRSAAAAAAAAARGRLGRTEHVARTIPAAVVAAAAVTVAAPPPKAEAQSLPPC